MVAGYLNSGPHAKQAFLPTKTLSQPYVVLTCDFVLISQRISEVGSVVKNKVQSVFPHCLTSHNYFPSFLCLNFFIYVIRIIVFASYGVVVAFSEACAEDLE